MSYHDASLNPSVRALAARARNLPTGPARAREARVLLQRLACLQERVQDPLPENLSRQMDDLQRQLSASMCDSLATAAPPGRATSGYRQQVAPGSRGAANRARIGHGRR